MDIFHGIRVDHIHPPLNLTDQDIGTEHKDPHESKLLFTRAPI